IPPEAGKSIPPADDNAKTIMVTAGKSPLFGKKPGPVAPGGPSSVRPSKPPPALPSKLAPPKPAPKPAPSAKPAAEPPRAEKPTAKLNGADLGDGSDDIDIELDDGSS